MKKITLENGKTIEISEESYQALVDAVKEPKWEDVVKERMLPNEVDTKEIFEGWMKGSKPSWLNDEEMQKDWIIFLHMLLWKKTYDADFVPDWEDGEQDKWYIWYHKGEKEYRLYVTWQNYDLMTVWFSSREKANRCLEDLKRIEVIE